jgi:hypothetical protein
MQRFLKTTRTAEDHIAQLRAQLPTAPAALPDATSAVTPHDAPASGATVAVPLAAPPSATPAPRREVETTS